MTDVKIEKTTNGYIVNLMDFTYRKAVFKDFGDLVEWLYRHFDEAQK